MALQGTLSDIGIIDLLQFPFAGRKTGELIVKSAKGRAALFYKEGVLVDARTERHEGQDAVVEVVDWEEGEFEFRPGVLAQRTTIELELHRVVMLALKTRDERRAEEQRKREEQTERERIRMEQIREHGIDPEACRQLEKIVRSQSAIRHASILGLNGDVLVEASSQEGEIEALEEMRLLVHTLRREHPRGALSRVFLEDSAGTLVAQVLGEGRLLVVLASPGVALGAASMLASKLAALFEKARS